MKGSMNVGLIPSGCVCSHAGVPISKCLVKLVVLPLNRNTGEKPKKAIIS